MEPRSNPGEGTDNALFRVLEESSDMICVVDHEGRFLRISNAVQGILGYSPDEIIGKSYGQFIHEDYSSISAQELNKVVNGQSAVDFETGFLHKDGHKVYISWSASWSDKDKVLYAIGRDITARKLTEEREKQHEKKYRSLFEQSVDAIMITDFSGNFQDVNQNLCNMFGYTHAELMGMNIRQLIESEELNERPIQFDELREGHHLFNRRNMLHKNGRIIPVEANVMKLNETTIVAIARDMTELRKAEMQIMQDEELFRDLVESSLVGVFIIQDGKYAYINPRFAEIFGYTQEELMNTVPVETVIHYDERHTTLENIRKRMAGLLDTAPYETRGLKKDLTEIWVEILASRSQYRGAPSIIGTLMDITLRKKDQQAIIESEARYRSLVDNAVEALVIMDFRKGHFTSVSDSACKLFGMPREELLRLGPVDVSPQYQPDGRLSVDKALEKIGEAIVGGKPGFEWLHRHKSGRDILCEVRLVRLPSEKDILVRGSIIDISDRKKLEAEKEMVHYMLRERVKELTTLYQTGQVLQNEHLGIHEALQRIAGFMFEGWQFPDICAARILYGEEEFSSPDFRATQWSQEASFTCSDGTHGHVEVVYLEEKPAESEGPFLSEERNLINMLAEMIRLYINRRCEAGALQQSEANLKTIFDTTNTIYVMTDAFLHIISYNHAAVEFARKELGITDPEHANLAAYFREDRRRDIDNVMARVMNGEEVRYEAEYPAADGPSAWYYVKFIPVLDDDRRVTGLMVSMDDVTEHKAQEKYAAGQVKLLKELSHIISHELRHEYVKLQGIINLVVDLDNVETEIKEMVNNSGIIFERLNESIVKLNDRIQVSFGSGQWKVEN